MKNIAWIAAALLISQSGIAGAQEVRSPAMDAASAYMEAVFPRQCSDRVELRKAGSVIDDKEWSFPYRDDRLDDSEADFTFHLFQMHCFLGPYMTGRVFLKQDENGDFSVITFATPSYLFDYVEGSVGSKIRTAPHIIGFRTEAILINADFVPSTRTIIARTPWRAMGDAWDKSVWSEFKGNFVMTRFEVDPTYDSETGAAPESPQSYVLVEQKKWQ